MPVARNARFRLVLLLAALGLLLGVHGSLAQSPHDACVILVSVDGMANYYLDDPKTDMPTLRRLAKEGAQAKGGMVCSFPTVTWPDHTTLVTGVSPARHGVIGNSYFDRKTGKVVMLLCDPLLDKDQTVRAPTVYDAAHRAGLKTAAVVWPATRSARSLDFNAPDMNLPDAWNLYGTKKWIDELRAAGLPVDRQTPWCHGDNSAERDWLYAGMTAQVLQKHSPNLLLLHLVNPDHVEHRYGPRTPEADWSMRYADDRLRDVFEAVSRSPKAGKTTLIVVGDHGFVQVRRRIQPNVLLKTLGLLRVAEGKTPKVEQRAAWCISQGGSAQVYVLDDSRRAEVLEQLRGALGKLEGIQKVIAPDEFASLGQPTRDQNPNAPDLWLAAKPGYDFSDTIAGDQAVVPLQALFGTHGYLPDQPDLLAGCVIWGPHVPAGVDLGKIRMESIAPTIAAILGVELPGAEGKALGVVKQR